MFTGEEEVFAFARACSRLVQMGSKEWAEMAGIQWFYSWSFTFYGSPSGTLSVYEFLNYIASSLDYHITHPFWLLVFATIRFELTFEACSATLPVVKAKFRPVHRAGERAIFEVDVWLYVVQERIALKQNASHCFQLVFYGDTIHCLFYFLLSSHGEVRLQTTTFRGYQWSCSSAQRFWWRFPWSPQKVAPFHVPTCTE